MLGSKAERATTNIINKGVFTVLKNKIRKGKKPDTTAMVPVPIDVECTIVSDEIKPVEEKKAKKVTLHVPYLVRNTKEKSYGVHSKKYKEGTGTMRLGQLTKAAAQEIDPEAVSISRDYCARLINGEFKDDHFLNKADKPYKMIKAFLDGSNVGTPEYEMNVMDLTRIINMSRRAIMHRPLSKDKAISKTLNKSYWKAENIHGYDTMKLMAWAVTHSWVTGLFLDAKGIFDVIPKTDSTLFPMWNAWISQQEDIRSEVKEMFIFKDGVCPYVLKMKDVFCVTREDHPTDDPPFDPDKADVEKVNLIPTEILIENAKLNEQYKQAVASDPDPKEEPKDVTPSINPEAEVKIRLNVEPATEAKKEESTPLTEEVSEEEAFAEEDASLASDGQMTFGELIADKISNGDKINPAIIASVLNNENRITPETLPAFIEANNKQAGSIPRLSKFTSYVNEAGKKVLYGPDSEYLGLIKAQIINDNGDVLRELRLDPCVMYGDTLRVITTDNIKGDIRRETFIPISNKEIVTAAINGPLTKDQRKQITSVLPRCLGDFRTKYSFLDKVDMRGLKTKDDVIGLPFDDWRRLVTNISNVLRTPKFPICRVRISEYKDPDNFQLSCDGGVLCAWPSGILNEASNINALQKGFLVNATSDSTKKDQEGYFYTGPDYDVAAKNKEITEIKK